MAVTEGLLGDALERAVQVWARPARILSCPTVCSASLIVIPSAGSKAYRLPFPQFAKSRLLSLRISFGGKLGYVLGKLVQTQTARANQQTISSSSVRMKAFEAR